MIQREEDRPIMWGEFTQARFGDVQPGDLIWADPVFGVEHVESIARVELPYGEVVLRIGLLTRSLAFPHLSGGSDQRYTNRNVARFPFEPTLHIRVVDMEMSRRARLARHAPAEGGE